MPKVRNYFQVHYLIYFFAEIDPHLIDTYIKSTLTWYLSTFLIDTECLINFQFKD